MNILVVSLLFPLLENPNRGIFVAHHVNDLEEAGHSVRIINPLPRMIRYAETSRSTLKGVARTPKKYSTTRHEVLSPKFIDFPDHPFPRMTLNSVARKAKWVIKNLGSWKPDIILCHTLFPSAQLALTLSKEWKIPWIGIVHGHDIDVGLQHQTTGRHIRSLAAKAGGLVCVSQSLLEKATMEQLNENILYIPCRTEVGKDWARPMKPWKGRWRKETIDILFPSDPRRLEKNFFLALQTGEELERRGWKVGITKLQHQPHDVALDRMLTADVTLITSHRESGPMTARESILCGTPVVTVNVGDMRTFLPPQWIREYDAIDLADGVEEALQHGWTHDGPSLAFCSKEEVMKAWTSLLEQHVE
ncbi:MAG: glycosyltransferase [archaeon]|nr:glycosyltransferase [archaeon]MDA1167289.1 glycosyltransferase [archaeon]